MTVSLFFLVMAAGAMLCVLAVLAVWLTEEKYTLGWMAYNDTLVNLSMIVIVLLAGGLAFR